MTSQIESAGRLILGADKISVVSHERPDGDAVGSLLAVTEALRASGRHPTPVMVSGVPGRFSFLEGTKHVVTSPPEGSDLFVIVDCSDVDRIGFPAAAAGRQPDIQIDHHPTNTEFAAVNIVQPEAAATTEILYDCLQAWGLPITPPVVAALMTGLVTDTIGFRTVGVTPRTLRLAGELLERGAPLPKIYERSLVQMSFVAARYWGSGLGRLDRADGLVWSSLTLKDRQQVGYPGPDDADLVNLLMTIEEAEVVLVFIEQSAEKVKVSWRSRPNVDVATVALQFGGGGHRPAAGAIIDGSLEEVQKRVIQATQQAMSQS